ncbi:hypothetical protein IW261DRAFT_515002 [Armillaria novae-zelandiae]|uniref:Uncharacterized protein n=1 Tax=Armillaria novae-zelandiae TaxID=153914 RepID=A0AA39P0F6_9AGAR|nr:hypothetical protein IW261DRAFT_515002 [Armillaria novae-zelandiae]
MDAFTVNLEQNELSSDWNSVLEFAENALILNDQLASSHPKIYAASCIFLLWQPVVLTWPFKICSVLISIPLAILRIPLAIARWFVRSLGFGNNTGIKRNSFASRYQSANYGGHVPRDSLFSGMQSFGAYNEELEFYSFAPCSRETYIALSILPIATVVFGVLEHRLWSIYDIHK